ncbi:MULTISPECIES: TonB-dependent receptor [unclassified Undibacterium]|uniref:TonB-dependent receptor n=1 Tax=unclassified Undibacterium TaxID=2630295 RepID=UPI002AC937ED|nr:MULTISPECIES: TonB-dependent receptor [unclassified Undibacterium]MEB0139808.1 TonB-dependent receptor plug domain-containing protein [Undibacterium sp. CCC2.1]MEB0170484.1 TonB-dependent receptor plug domain-containing protein [Undibacterium sp. CCC1.1]MEB0174425.1 TonB-dependent receptor plug domain-containing protein [Undibacterium sp. CCC3.4]MEB0213778.1 TonB-dependent receptor plug domain-containing protein [Undibacterium sp. 5I2]WPX43941.1 TonB-dependent receptor plug domain-containin
MRRSIRSFQLTPSHITVAVATLCAALSAPAIGQNLTVAAAPTAAAASDASVSTVEISSEKTRSSVTMSGKEIQKVIPGVNPLKALETLPGVSFQTADPWGNNEQNISLVVHGFNGQQLGYTMDGVPLGDQQYGNYNGLSPQRAVTSENVRRVVLSTGAADLGTASTSNLGGAIETYSSDPQKERNINVQQTVGSHNASRSFVRVDTGEFGEGNSAYVSVLHHEAKAWDFDGRQSDDQVNAKFIHQGKSGKLTVYADWSDKTEPNEDSILHSPTISSPYTRPFLYPDFNAALNYLSTAGAPPAAAGSNFQNYYSDAQRTDKLAYLKYDAYLNDNITWSNQFYYHHDDGVGVVAGPINQAGLPALFSVYFPNQNLKQVFGNSGYATRTTEYNINRKGLISTLHIDLDAHSIETGIWAEHNQSTAYRRWYALNLANPSSPYTRPGNLASPLITQYGSSIDNQVLQFYLQDEWKVRPDLALQAGFKSSLQFANGTFPVQELPAAIGSGSTGLPEGQIDTKKWFLPQVGMRWDIDAHDQLFASIQQNMRQFVTYGGGGASPWSLATQAAFNLFAATAKPETSLTFELGLRDKRQLNLGPITAFEGQIDLYHVDFSNRLLAVSSNPIITSFVGGTTLLANVGTVKTNGVDLAGTLHFGQNFSLYDAVSYNDSKYQDNYTSGSSLILTADKSVPGAPKWMNKFVASANIANVDVQLTGDFVGRRYATYTNDLSISSYFLMGLNIAGKLPLPSTLIKNPRWNIAVTNLANRQGSLELNGSYAVSGSYAVYPIPPRQAFLTVKADF